MWHTYLSDSVSTGNPFRRDGLIRRSLLLWLPLVLGFVLFPFKGNADDAAFIAGVGLAVLWFAGVGLLPWDRLPRGWTVLPVLVCIASVGLLRYSAGGGVSGYGPLLLIPAVWAALFADRVQAVIVIVAVGLAVALPPLIGGDAGTGEWRRSLLTVLAAAAAAVAISSLVTALRKEMDERAALERRFRHSQALQMNDAVVQDLAVAKYSLDSEDTTQAREALERALERSKEIVGTLIPEDDPIHPGDLTRRPPDA